MNARQTIISKLSGKGLEVSSNELELYLFEYKKKFGGKYRAIDLIFDMLDNEADFEDFIEFLEKLIAGRQPCY